MKKSILFTLLMFGFLFSSGAEPLQPGSPAPSLTAVDSTGTTLDLSEMFSEGTTLVYFYPKSDTPGCTAQACNLRDSFEELSETGISVIGVSGDSVKAQAAFKEKYNLPFILISDADHSVMEAFGVPNRMGFASRQSFLIMDGEVVWADLSATPRSQAKDALAAYHQKK